MTSKNPFLYSLAIIACCASASPAATLSISSGSSATFGRTDGVFVPFAAPAASNWSPTLVNGQVYAINSVSYIKNNTDATFANLWIGIYTSYTPTSGALSGFLGSSSNSVAWGTAANGSTQNWNFSGVSATADTSSTLYLMFQTSATAIGAQLDVAEGAIALRRLPDADGGLAAGAGIIQGEATTRNDRTPFMTLATTAVPEPSTLLLSTLGGLVLLRRKR